MPQISLILQVKYVTRQAVQCHQMPHTCDQVAFRITTGISSSLVKIFRSFVIK